ncbi:hypothetical protein BV898_10574 [Hypsibius exemplaris]|uniref:Ciliogenesis-associated TTC17-interacting protein N-terminal domain-containing protein n=1 Tax=Hypsibius exemplaris TaxID=2072580 RepID=A0A1W0WIZ4_HYPEX|nr:hypothetical protein BV898_10574 [Hypsibius exemplaris]
MATPAQAEQLNHFKTPEIPLPDYENFEFDSKETPEYIAKIRAALDSPRKSHVLNNAYGVPQATPFVSGEISKEAATFLASIKPQWLLQLLYDQVLDVYEGERIIGSYTVSIARVPNDVRQFVFHITSRFITDTGGVQTEEIFDGIVTDKLETVCEKHTFTEESSTISIDNKRYVECQPNESYAVSVLRGDGEKVSTWLNVYTLGEVKGYVSECAHVLLSRLFSSEEAVPENFHVMALDAFGHFREVQYRKLKSRMMTFRPYKLDCFGFSRELAAGKEQTLHKVEEFFLNRRLIYREEAEREVMIKTHAIPPWKPTHYVAPVDLQVAQSTAMEEHWYIQMRRTESQASFKKKFANTVVKFPQLTQPLKEMVHLILTVRPDDVFAFVSECFRNWKDIYAEPELLNSNGMILSLDHCDRKPEPQAAVYQLLRSFGVNPNE